MAAHNWLLDDEGEVDTFAAEWGEDCYGPQCPTCNEVICCAHADDPEKLADRIFADCPGAA
ncbi:hypothetical protein ABZ342_15290 [Amycolatopsis sp. NPDC005961]|uniref:hypothetical protein n=1 Tax=Amycolatopsis sp. NPDC005961 TaxID=3156720 RepID=UPI0033CDDFF1